MVLEEYQRKRNVKHSPEPAGRKRTSAGKALQFVVQEHHASHLHYDFRLELEGVLKSWAIPKGPSLDPQEKRLAVMVEDHPLDYASFEGIIPEGNYGAGTVKIWDSGTYHPPGVTERKPAEEIFLKGLEKGTLDLVLEGTRLKGGFTLVKMKGRGDNNWLLIKKHDEHSSGQAGQPKEHAAAPRRKRSGKKDSDDGDPDLNNASVTRGSTRHCEESATKQSPHSVRVPRGIASSRTPRNDDVSRRSPRMTEALPDLSRLPRASMPHRVSPMLAAVAEHPFDDPEWLFEVKWDGYRAIAEVHHSGEVELYSRNFISFNDRYAGIVEGLRSLARDAVLDGEVVVLDGEGRANFQLLQNYSRRPAGEVIYYVFDLLYLDGHDLSGLPLIERKGILHQLVTNLPQVRYCEHVEGEGKAFYQVALENGLEGVMAKQARSRYEIGRRSQTWLKCKVQQREEAVIAGFTRPRGSRSRFGALVLGVYDEGQLRYIGHTGTGFSEAELEKLYQQLDRLRQTASPFAHPPPTNTPVTWVKPDLVCEVEYKERTEDGILRQPSFIRLREDKTARQMKREKVLKHESRPVKSARKATALPRTRAKFTNLEKVYWPREQYTKGDLINYYAAVAPYILPYIQDRPLTLNRYPDGIEGAHFYQRDMEAEVPDFISVVPIRGLSGGKSVKSVVGGKRDTLLYLANLGCIEMNPWLSRVGSLERPDYLVLDLDPEQVPFAQVVKVALGVAKVLAEAGAKSFCKTSGATGLHIYVPVAAMYSYEQVRQFAEIVARLVNQQLPAISSIVRDPAQRQGKVYLDYLQNNFGQTVAAPYSVRPQPGATVSTPLRWSELKPKLDPTTFTIRTILPRLKKVGELWQPLRRAKTDLEACLARLQRKYG